MRSLLFSGSRNRATRAAQRSDARFRLESLEPRRNLCGVSISDIHLVDDTGVSSTDKVTSDATISASATAEKGGPVTVTITDSVGNVTSELTASGGFTFDPVAADAALANYDGPVELQIQATDSSGKSCSKTFSFVLDNIPLTVNGINDVTVNENTKQTPVDLNSGFADAPGAAGALKFDVIGNSNSGLFKSVKVSGDGTLNLDLAKWQYGSATLTVEATDRAGNTATTTFTVTVDQIPPVITGFHVKDDGGDVYSFVGKITDAVPGDDYVEIGGIASEFDVSAYANANGTFDISAWCPDMSTGIVTAQAYNPQGLVSNTASYDLT